MSETSWAEIGAQVFYRRYPSVNVNVGLVVGDEGALVIDTRATPVQGEEALSHVHEVTRKPVRWVVNTHYHWDHTFGNQAFARSEIWGHPATRRFLLEKGRDAVGEAVEWNPSLAPDFDRFEPVAPDHLVDAESSIDLGGRTIRLEYPGRAHTDSDIVVRVPNAGVVFAGDIFESGAPPWFGDGFPVAWFATAERVLAEGDTVAIPGHGPAMTPAAVAAQVEELRAVATMCRAAHEGGIAAEDMDVGESPYPEATMREAIRRGLLELSARD